MSDLSRREPPAQAPISMWLSEPLTDELKAAVERLRRLDSVRRIAIMPDVHLSVGVCVGAVIATDDLIYPQAVGSDIGCGMSAVALDGPMPDEWGRSEAQRVLGLLRESVPILRHRALGMAPMLSDDLDPEKLSHPALAAAARREGRIELGTLGRGNHFLELQRDDTGRLWIMVHSGSRVMGQAISRHHLAHADRIRSGVFALRADETPGRAYLDDADWAVRFAAASRRVMADVAARCFETALGVRADWGTFADASHNHVRLESHGTSLWVHRKGASPAAAGTLGLIPGSMGTESFHVIGRGCPEALCSSSHGAGRAMSRSEARTRISAKRCREELAGVHVDESIAGRLTEESPSAYRDIRRVMRAQRELVRIERTLTPVLCYKGT